MSRRYWLTPATRKPDEVMQKMLAKMVWKQFQQSHVANM